MDKNKIIMGLGVLVAMGFLGLYLMAEIGKAGRGWSERRTEEVVNAFGVIDQQISGMEDEALEAAWARGDDATADFLIQNIEAREAATQAMQQQLNQARVDAGLAPPVQEPPPTGLLALDQQPKRDRAAEMAMMPFIAAAGAGVVVGLLGLVGAVIILRSDDVAGLVEATQGEIDPEDVEIEFPTENTAPTAPTEHTLNARSQLKDAIASLREAEMQLTAVEMHLEAAAASWTGSKVDRVKALKAFQVAILTLADGGITVDPGMTDRALTWPQGRRSAEELRDERDGVIALLGVVRFMIAQERR